MDIPTEQVQLQENAPEQILKTSEASNEVRRWRKAFGFEETFELASYQRIKNDEREEAAQNYRAAVAKEAEKSEFYYTPKTDVFLDPKEVLGDLEECYREFYKYDPHWKDDLQYKPEVDQFKVDRQTVLAYLSTKGVINPEPTLKNIEALIIGSTILDRRPDGYNPLRYQVWNHKAWSKVADPIRELYKNIQSSDDLTRSLQLLGTSSADLTRFIELTGYKSLEFSFQEELSYLAELEAIPESSYQHTKEQLTKYRYLIPKIDREDDPEKKFALFLKIAENGIPPKLQKVLDLANRIGQITKAEQLGTHPVLNSGDFDLIIEQEDRLRDELLILEELTKYSQKTTERYEYSQKKEVKRTKVYDYLMKEAPKIFARFDTLSKTGELHNLAECIRKGIVVGDNNASILVFGSTEHGNQGINSLKEDLKKTTVLIDHLQDEEYLGYFLFLKELSLLNPKEYYTESLQLGEIDVSRLKPNDKEVTTLNNLASLSDTLFPERKDRLSLLGKNLTWDEFSFAKNKIQFNPDEQGELFKLLKSDQVKHELLSLCTLADDDKTQRFLFNKLLECNSYQEALAILVQNKEWNLLEKALKNEYFFNNLSNKDQKYWSLWNNLTKEESSYIQLNLDRMKRHVSLKENQIYLGKEQKEYLGQLIVTYRELNKIAGNNEDYQKMFKNRMSWIEDIKELKSLPEDLKNSIEILEHPDDYPYVKNFLRSAREVNIPMTLLSEVYKKTEFISQQKDPYLFQWIFETMGHDLHPTDQVKRLDKIVGAYSKIHPKFIYTAAQVFYWKSFSDETLESLPKLVKTERALDVLLQSNSNLVKQLSDVPILEDLVNRYDSIYEGMADCLPVFSNRKNSIKLLTALLAYEDVLLKDTGLYGVIVRYIKESESFMQDVSDVDFLAQFAIKYKQSHFEYRDWALSSFASNKLSKELLMDFPDYGKSIGSSKDKGLIITIFNNTDLLIKDRSDIKFINDLVGTYSTKADKIIKSYIECLKAKVITTSDKEVVLSCLNHFNILNPKILEAYKKASLAGTGEVYATGVKSLLERISQGTVTKDDREKNYYQGLLEYVYPNNSGAYSPFEKNIQAEDRSQDLAEFKLRDRYEIDLLAGSTIRIKEGQSLDPQVRAGFTKVFSDLDSEASKASYDLDKIKQRFIVDIDQKVQGLLLNELYQGLGGEQLGLEEKISLLLFDCLYGNKTLSPKELKSLLLSNYFSVQEGIAEFNQKNNSYLASASNPDYVYYSQLDSFYSDSLKEVIRANLQMASNNPKFTSILPKLFSKLNLDLALEQRQQKINKLQISKLGESEGFVKQMGKALERRKGKIYSPDQVKRAIHLYEMYAKGLTEISSTSSSQTTKAFYGQLKSQRDKTIQAVNELTDVDLDPREIHLGEINLEEYLETEKEIVEGVYNEEHFVGYTGQRLIDLFDSEKNLISSELNKFESENGKKREVLNGVITKNKESVFARQVGGVCVAGDMRMWNMKNYFQLVLYNPDTYESEGLVLLHNFTENGKKILTASFNPSSTYLYSVDESALFKGLTSTLENFAQENEFDVVAVSNNRGIRTNRTGGEFERAMDERVRSIGKSFSFEEKKTFSYLPQYSLDRMDAIWENQG